MSTVNEAIAALTDLVASLQAEVRDLKARAALPGPAGERGPRGQRGRPGHSIAGIDIEADGKLSFRLDDPDGTVLTTTGSIIGPEGPAGPAGETGAQGIAGAPGRDGKGIDTIGWEEVNDEVRLEIVTSDGELHQSNNLRGPPGEDGATGNEGGRGQRGVGIDHALIIDGKLKLVMTDGKAVIAGDVTGPEGPEGPAGERGQRGYSICDATIEDGKLKLASEVGDVITAGKVVGPRGPRGPQGKDGRQGAAGPVGATGDPGDGMLDMILVSHTGEVVGGRLKNGEQIAVGVLEHG
jgi:hypothetical protein